MAARVLADVIMATERPADVALSGKVPDDVVVAAGVPASGVLAAVDLPVVFKVIVGRVDAVVTSVVVL